MKKKNLIPKPCNSEARSQQWKIESRHLSSKSKIKNRKFGEYLTSPIANGHKLTLSKKKNTYLQKFKIIKNSDGFYTIKNKNGSKCIDLRDGSLVKNGNIMPEVWQYSCNSSAPQIFKFERL